MNAQPREKKWVTPEAYLEDEKGSDVKYEYYDGEVFAMTGASLNHNRINGNLFSEIKNQLKESYCDAFASDMRVKITPLEKYTYPDIVVACNDIELEKKMGLETLINPVIIIEVLSESTEAYDRGKKFPHYRQIPSLKEYILVSQGHCFVERYVRSDDGTWHLSSFQDMEQTLIIKSIRCELAMSDIYHRVEFEA